MKGQQAYCEPFHIEKSQLFEIHKVAYSDKEPYSCFMHFHEVHELIIFNNISGRYFYSQGESGLRNNDLVFTPSLETHNFECSSGEKSWFIVQFLPAIFELEDMREVADRFVYGTHLRLTQEHVHIVKQQASWLETCYQQDPHGSLSLNLLKTLILWIAKHAEVVNAPNCRPFAISQNYQKLKPLMDIFRRQACVTLSLDEAAETCFMSPGHFSRMFKSVFRFSYSEYSLRHKLYSAARLISQTDKSITEISYELNFSSPSHFIAQFKKQFLITPKKYRRGISLT